MFTRSLFRFADQNTARLAAGFSLTKVQEDMSSGFRARFMFSESKSTVFMQYSSQIGQKRGTNASADGESERSNQRQRMFSQPLVVGLPTASVIRMLTALEGGEGFDFASRAANGRFEAADADGYTFSLKGKSNSTVAEGVPSEFDFNIDAGHAIMLHRFLKISLNESMGFSTTIAQRDDGQSAQQQPNRRNQRNN